MARSGIRQADIERIMRAADRTGAKLQIDMKTMTVVVIPAVEGSTLDLPNRSSAILPLGAFAPDGKENFE